MIMKQILKNKYSCSLLLIVVLIEMGCEKFLQEKPDSQLAVPTTISDYQAILDNDGVFNLVPMGLGEASADNYYLSYENWSALDLDNRNIYTWRSEINLDNLRNNEWMYLYRQVYYANVVLEGIQLSLNKSSSQWSNVQGQALFYRARVFFIIATTFAQAYDKATASGDLGIPLRLSSDFNQKSTRASIQETYEQIINDLKNAIRLLPVIPKHVMRPSKPAAYGMLARVYLAMRKYKQAGIYADSCLSLYDNLLDFNNLNALDEFPIQIFNKETIFYAKGGLTMINDRRAKVDTTLLSLYEPNDLRKEIFFRENEDGSFAFKGNYTESPSLFMGIATDEMMLIKAECLARNGSVSKAMKVLNALLVKRWKAGTFAPFTASDKKTAIKLILTERRKELLMRNLRWMDLKRLNKEQEFKRDLIRNLNGKTYVLKPGAHGYSLPIPQSVIELSGMQQNPR